MHISKKIQQRARNRKIFARWHLAIAITSNTEWITINYSRTKRVETHYKKNIFSSHPDKKMETVTK